MKTDDFDFDLPKDRIAQRPVSPRDSARLLEIAGSLADRAVRDLPNLLAPGDVMVFNDTRVIPARLNGLRGEAKIELTLHRRLADGSWRAFARPARRLKPGDRIEISSDFFMEVAEKLDGGEIAVRPNLLGQDFTAALSETGTMPVPPYIGRADAPRAEDRSWYQTVYARRDGAVAAPTAGLHFSEPLLKAVDEAGVRRVAVTLHVGAGTFLPVTAEQARDHRMHAEWGGVSPEAAAAINEARAVGGRVLAVGTTSLRLVESAAGENGVVSPFEGETELFILPGYRFRAVDLLLTNFHLPRSTLFMLVCAFAGTVRMKTAYAHAIAGNYRFYSYGDACLLHRNVDA